MDTLQLVVLSIVIGSGFLMLAYELLMASLNKQLDELSNHPMGYPIDFVGGDDPSDLG